ncbi:ATP-binding protein [Kitasatospora sp. NPDC094019]|uniref:ATP-binding protein n=1 Tax=Kitasatospora sp. NPDC094019 TaxID=3364091 RepID=UPI003823EBD5
MPCLRLPRRPREFAARFPSRADSAPLARSFLRAYLAGLPRGERYSDVAELLLGELVTNAVRHSDAPPDRLIEVRFAVAPADRLRLEVHDAGGGRPVLRPDVDPEEECGRGLLLVDELAERWGCCPRAGGIGKFVWVLVSPASGFTDLVFGRSPRLVTV